MPADVEQVKINFADIAAGAENAGAIRLDKLLARSGLADSVSDGLRKIKQKAVRVNGEVKSEPILRVQVPTELTLRVGRNMRRVSIS